MSNENTNFKHFFDNEPKKASINKGRAYLDVYEKYMSKYKNKKPIILEIGIDGGGSIEMWNYYFNGNCTIYAIDIEQKSIDIVKKLKLPNVHAILGDQGNETFWDKFLQDKCFDIIIDDGGHTMQQQIMSFEKLYRRLNLEGVYICEDTCTSYWQTFGGGYKNLNSFIEYSKNFIDMINYQAIASDRNIESTYDYDKITKNFIDWNRFENVSNALHYYQSMVIIEKLPFQCNSAIRMGPDI